jgi:hypothetical protein
MQLHDYYKKYGKSFLSADEFVTHWGEDVQFKLMDNRVCASPLYVRKLITDKLNTLFNIESVPDEIHHTIMTAYFECLIEFNIIPVDTTFKEHLHFDSDKVRIFQKGFLNFRRPQSLSFPEEFEKQYLVDRVVFNNAIIIDDKSQYNFYTIMSNYGNGSVDNEFIKMSYYIMDGIFHFQAPKSADKLQVTLTMPIDEIHQHYEHIKKLIKKKLFTSFYENVSKMVFRKVLDFEMFNSTHLAILVLLGGKPIKELMAFMDENGYLNDLLTLTDAEIYELYSVSSTTFEMMKI